MLDEDQADVIKLPAWMSFFASTNVTLIVISALIILALTGAIVPQVGILDDGAIFEWKQDHPAITPVLARLGLFATFHSGLFLISLAVLFLNTLACTLKSILVDRLFPENRPSTRLKRLGFIILHISILVCMAGGFVSAGFRTSGKIILTEGQTLADRKQNYSKLSEGPFGRLSEQRFRIRLNEAQFEPPTDWCAGRKHASVRLEDINGDFVSSEIDFNYPARQKGLTFTLQEIGFSPLINISVQGNKKLPYSCFLALKVWGVNKTREHRDFLPMQQSGERLVVNLLPSHTISNGVPVKTSETLQNPALLVHLESPEGVRSTQQLLELGKEVEVENLNIKFTELRRWASFLVVQDPGYPIVLISLLMAISALILRYTPDVLEWIKEARHDAAG